jgi:hypothetical protein
MRAYDWEDYIDYLLATSAEIMIVLAEAEEG